MNINSLKTTQIKTLVIGAGPAGLSFGYSYSEFRNDFLIVDMGKCLTSRERNDEFDCIAGLGGAGLFSDGKFSFFPSGTNIWKLRNQEILKDAYSHLQGLFKNSIDFKVPDFPEDKLIKEMKPNEVYELKEYPSFYISLEDRTKLVQEMINRIKDKLLLGWKVIDWHREDAKYLVQVEKEDSKQIIECESIVLAGGRFHPLLLKNVSKEFKRYEYGIRIVGSNSEFDLIRSETTIDPKWIYKPSPDIEYRTFCMCQDGEYVQSNFMGISSYSGRADIPPTGITNFGLTVRLKKNLDVEFDKILQCSAFELPLDKILENPLLLEEKYGKELTDIYLKGLLEFLKDFKLNPRNLKIIGPSIEGVGEYPKIDEHLKVERENIFAIGDCSGIFRGIIPSMLSGHFVGITLGK